MRYLLEITKGEWSIRYRRYPIMGSSRGTKAISLNKTPIRLKSFFLLIVVSQVFSDWLDRRLAIGLWQSSYFPNPLSHLTIHPPLKHPKKRPRPNSGLRCPKKRPIEMGKYVRNVILCRTYKAAMSKAIDAFSCCVFIHFNYRTVTWGSLLSVGR